MEFRQSLGYVTRSTKSILLDFDRYLLFRDIASTGQIDEGLVVNWVHVIRSNSSKTKNAKLACLRKFLHYLIRLDLIAVNPALSIPYLKERPFKPYIYSLKEIGGLLEAARRFEARSRRDRCFAWRTMQTMICLIYACGLRLTEALNLRIKDVDFSEATLSLWRTKFHKERLAPLSPEMAIKLKEYLALRVKRYPPANPTSPFFCHARGKYAGRSIETLFRKLLIACALSKPNGPAPRIHDLRHSFAVHRLYQWYQEGQNILNKLALLSTYMGHARLENTQVYLTITQALLREGNRRFREYAEGIPQSLIERSLSRHANRRS